MSVRRKNLPSLVSKFFGDKKEETSLLFLKKNEEKSLSGRSPSTRMNPGIASYSIPMAGSTTTMLPNATTTLGFFAPRRSLWL